MRNLIVTAVAAGLMCAGCTPLASRIAPRQTSVAPFEAMTCNQLSDKLIADQADLEKLSGEQDHARSEDDLGVALLGLPLARMSGGNRESQIAAEKGEIQAVQEAREIKKCQAAPAASNG